MKNSFINVMSNAFANAGAFRGLWVVLVVWIFGHLFPEDVDFSQAANVFSKGMSKARNAIGSGVHEMHNAASHVMEELQDLEGHPNHQKAEHNASAGDHKWSAKVVPFEQEQVHGHDHVIDV